MAISFNRYVSITSGVGAGSSVSVGQLILRLKTTNPLVAPGTGLYFSNAADVGTYFGTTSAEYLRAAFYFGWISKNITQPPAISFSRWVNAAAGGYIYGITGSYGISQFTPITSGGFGLTLGGYTGTLSGINLSGAGSLAAVAAAIQTAIRAVTAGGAAWTGATVAYDPTRQSFQLTSGTLDINPVSVTPAITGTDLAVPLGWYTGAIFGSGAAVETLTQTMTTSANNNNNFGTFSFIPTLTLAQHIELAVWNKTYNNLFRYSVPVLPANAGAWSAGLLPYGGTDLTLSPIATEFPELIPATVEAATDYTKTNAVQNFMYQLNFPCTPSVTTDTDANIYDALRINYYGQTQVKGNKLVFYQRGLMMGGTTDPVDMNIYANEQWLKNDATAGFFNLLLSVPEVSAGNQGLAQCLGIIQGTIDRALDNGTFTKGKTLTDVQQLYITQATNDPLAWRQVQNSGYWLKGQIIQRVNPTTNLNEYDFVYTLIYSKNDAVRGVIGTHVLI